VKRQKIFRSEGKNVAMILRRERLFFLLAFSFHRKEKVMNNKRIILDPRLRGMTG
jgi:hypothetical protein